MTGWSCYHHYHAKATVSGLISLTSYIIVLCHTHISDIMISLDKCRVVESRQKIRRLSEYFKTKLIMTTPCAGRAASDF